MSVLSELTEDRIKVIANDFVKDYIKREKEYESYFGSEEFNNVIYNVIPTLLQWSKTTYLSSHDYEYSTEEPLLDGTIFNKVCNTIFRMCEVSSDETANFPTNYVEIGELLFEVMYGQGSCYYISLKEK